MISEIIPNLSIGTIWDAIHANREDWGLIICVAEYGSLANWEIDDLLCQDRKLLMAPFCDYTNAGENLQNTKANKSVLDFIADEILQHRAKHPILIHCAAGVERSPLAVIYYLSRYWFRSSKSPREIFEFVKSKRPIVEDRLNWLDWEDEK